MGSSFHQAWNRRTVVAIGLGLLVSPLMARAQPSDKTRRIGLLSFEELAIEQRRAMSFALAERGWGEGRNLVIHSRSGNGNVARLGALAEELVRLDVELIVGVGTIAAQAAQRATGRIPIVFYASGDPVGVGLVASAARPGANITGNTVMSFELDLKRVQVLRELLPTASRVAHLLNAANPVSRTNRDAVERAFRSVGFKPIFIEVSTASELETTIEDATRRGAQALLVSSDPLFASPANFKRVMRTVEGLRLPTMLQWGSAGVGALVAVGPNWREVDRQFAEFVDRILKGANPGALPIEQPTTFWLSINLGTAKALGVTVPQSLLILADEVLQ